MQSVISTYLHEDNVPQSGDDNYDPDLDKGTQTYVEIPGRRVC
jgi:hypothetical protein